MHWTRHILNKVNRLSKSPKKQLQFGYLMILVLHILIIISVYKKGIVFNVSQIGILCLISCTTILVLCFRRGLFPLLFLWLLFGELMGRVTNYVVLGIIYYLVFSPIALILNIFNKKRRYPSGWINRNSKIDYDSLS